MAAGFHLAPSPPSCRGCVIADACGVEAVVVVARRRSTGTTDAESTRTDGDCFYGNLLSC